MIERLNPSLPHRSWPGVLAWPGPLTPKMTPIIWNPPACIRSPLPKRAQPKPKLPFRNIHVFVEQQGRVFSIAAVLIQLGQGSYTQRDHESVDVGDLGIEVDHIIAEAFAPAATWKDYQIAMKQQVFTWLRQQVPDLPLRLDGWGERKPPGLLIITVRVPEHILPSLFRISGMEGHFLMHTRKNAPTRMAQDHLCVVWKEGATLDEMRAFNQMLAGTWGVALRSDTLGLRVHRAHLEAARKLLGGAGARTEGAHFKQFLI